MTERAPTAKRAPLSDPARDHSASPAQRLPPSAPSPAAGPHPYTGSRPHSFRRSPRSGLHIREPLTPEVSLSHFAGPQERVRNGEITTITTEAGGMNQGGKIGTAQTEREKGKPGEATLGEKRLRNRRKRGRAPSTRAARRTRRRGTPSASHGTEKPRASFGATALSLTRRRRP